MTRHTSTSRASTVSSSTVAGRGSTDRKGRASHRRHRPRRIRELEDEGSRHPNDVASGLRSVQRGSANELRQRHRSCWLVSQPRCPLNSDTDRHFFSAGRRFVQRCSTSAVGQKPKFLRVQGDACKDPEPTHFDRPHQHRHSCALLQRRAMIISQDPKDDVSRVPSIPNHDW